MRHSFFIILSTLILFSGCKPDIDEFVPYEEQAVSPGGDVGRFFAAIRPNSQKIIIDDISNQNELKVSDDIRLQFDANTFIYSNGLEAVGKAEMEIILGRSKADMIFNNTPSVSGDRILESLKSIQITLTQGGQPLTVGFGKAIFLSFKSTEGVEVQLFYGQNKDQRSFDWIASLEDSFNGEASVTPYEYYDSIQQHTNYGVDVWAQSLGWVNLSTIWYNGNLGSDICINLPEQYQSSNTTAFLAFSQRNSIVKLDWDDQSEMSQLCAKNIPNGVNGVIIVIADQEEEGQYGFANVYLEVDGDQTISLEPQSRSIGHITEWLSSL